MATAARRLTALLIPCLLLALAPAAFGQALKPQMGLKKGANKPPPAPKETEKLTGFKVGPETLTRFEVDTAWRKNTIEFTSKAPKETIKGSASKVDGHLDINPRNIDSALGKFTVQWADVATGKDKMDEHLRSSQWMDAAVNPKITFTVRGLENLKPNPNGKSVKATLLGVWGMHGVEKDIKIPCTVTYIEPPKGKTDAKEGISIRSLFKLGLEEFDVKGKGVGTSVAPKIDVKVIVNLVKTDKQPGAADEESEDKADKAGDSDEKEPKKKDADDGMTGGGG